MMGIKLAVLANIYIYIYITCVSQYSRQGFSKKKKKDNVCDVKSTKSQVCGPIKC